MGIQERLGGEKRGWERGESDEIALSKGTQPQQEKWYMLSEFPGELPGVLPGEFQEASGRAFGGNTGRIAPSKYFFLKSYKLHSSYIMS